MFRKKTSEPSSNGPTVQASALGCLVLLARRHGLDLSEDRLIRDNFIDDVDQIDFATLQRGAENAGLKIKALDLTVADLKSLKDALPLIVTTVDGGSMILTGLETSNEGTRIALQDPRAAAGNLLILDQFRFEQIWTGKAIVVKRNYDLTDEEQPFQFGLLIALISRERRLVRDIAICAVVLGFVALAPIVFMRVLFDKVLTYQAFSTLYVLSIALLVIILFEAAFIYLRGFLVLLLTTRFDAKLMTYIFNKVLHLPMDFFERTQVGKIAYDMNQLNRVRSFLSGQVFGTVLDSTTLLFFLPVMFFFSPTLTAIVLGICGLIGGVMMVMLPTYRRKAALLEAAESQRGAFLVQTLHGMRTVKSLSLDARQRHMYDVLAARVAKLRFDAGMTSNLLQTIVTPLERLAVSGALGLGVYFALTSQDPVYIGALFAFMILSRRVVGPLVHLAKLIDQYDEARLAVNLLSDLVNQPQEEGRSGQGVRVPLRGELAFSGVTFSYQGAVSPALRNVSFEAPLGTTLGIMGKSGSGKTTITRLLQRLHSDYGGLIKIDGIDVREYDVDHLRHSLGVVLQENFLFSGTIRENIAAAKSDATFEDVVRAARLAGAEEFIDKLPRGYETYIYEGSPNLSGGQRQRLAIARALITDPRILILDEATSALDADSEAIVNANLARIAQGRTMIIISHRLSALVHADAILVLNGGEVLDIGKHDELVDRCDIYRELWYLQNKHLNLVPGTPLRTVRRVS
ncbi:MAG: peptidase domain-containing ABC transporter [Xanthobacteraceae bacterium]|nr:peptidase domain-containing ABC transporter [Xanthobacteraceae bacterium]